MTLKYWHTIVCFFAAVNLQKHRLKWKDSASKSSSIKFLWRCVSKGAPMTCNLYATPLQLVAFELLRLVFTFIIFGWYQVIIFFVCLSKAKESGKKSRQPLNFCHKKDLRQSRDLNLKDFIHFLKVLSWYGFPCWVLSQTSGQCWELIQIIRAHFVPGCVSAIWIPTSFNLQDRNEWNCNWGDCKSLVGCCELILISRARFVPDHWSWMDVLSLKV